jgi:ferrous iron transport protein B
MVALRTPLVALVGNPNTGKTTLFNALAGMNQRVGNYPGVTVETKKGKFNHRGRLIEIVDLPGTYSLAPRSPDEMVAVDVVLGHTTDERPDVIVTIVDASNLERNLYLTTQVLELGVPVVVALNMTDVAEGQGLKIDVEQLARRLGLPVVPLQANRRKGLDQLRQAIADTLDHPTLPAAPTFPPAFEDEVARLATLLGEQEPMYLVRRLLLDAGGAIETLLVNKHGEAVLEAVHAGRLRLTQAGCGIPTVEARTRYGWIRTITAGCIQRPAQRPVSWTDRLDRVLTHRIWGTLIFLCLMFVVFQSIFFWARPLMDAIGAGKDALKDLVTDAMSPGPLRGLLTEGILEGVGSVLTFVPQIMILFAFLAVLEDCGYMARAAFLMDRLMARAGLNGKSFIPLLSSVACAVPGIMSARVIENRRDRLATILVAPLMSCSARLPVYALLIGAFLSPKQGYGWWVPGLTLFGLYLIGLVVAPLMAFVLKRTLLRGDAPIFVMEMPLYKRPSLRMVLRRAFDGGWLFVKRAGTLILASMVVIWALLYFPGTDAAGQPFEQRVAALESELKEPLEELATVRTALEKLDENDAQDAPRIAELRERRLELRAQVKPIADVKSEWKAHSLLGRVGKFIEPAVEPLGWDWRIGLAALASFPAREVMVGTLGIIFNQGEGKSDDEAYRDDIGNTMHEAFTVPVALSVMVFFALCCQCASTLVVIKRETKSWFWPAFTFTYMTVLAYVCALVVFQVSRLFL